MTEERITLAIMELLRNSGYEIVTFNFPQGGGGLTLHSSDRRGKNDDSIVPDVLAKQSDTVIFLENKVLYSQSDIEKLRRVRDSHLYDDHLRRIGVDRSSCAMKFGVGLQDTPKNRAAFKASASDLDLLFTMHESGRIDIPHGSI